MADASGHWVEIVGVTLDLEAVHRFLMHPNAGGTCVFVGRTRQWTSGTETSALRYESYAPMAVTEMRRLVNEARARWDLLRAVTLHRTGDVPVGEASVVIGVACAHRGPAFEAARWLIDTLKETVPIWKTDL